MLFYDCEIYLAYVCWLYVILFNLLFPVFQKISLMLVFTARCYASAVLAMGLCLSVSVCVRPSVTSQSSTKTVQRRITQTTPHDTQGV